MTISQATHDEIDAMLEGADFYRDPYPAYVRLRAESPVHWHVSGGTWLVTRYADVEAVFRDVAHFSSYGFQNKYMESLRPELRAAAPTMEWRGRTPTIITSDPPSHTRVRKLLQAAFSPRAILALRDTAQAVVDEMLDSVAGQSSFDFVETLAYPLPAIMIADIMGVPREDRGQFKTIARTVMRFFARANPNSELTVEFAKESDAALAEFRDYLAALLAERRRSPQDDAVSTLVHAEIDGDRLSEEELIVNLVLFLMAGHETTTNMLSTGLRLLLEHPEAMARIRENRDLLPVAIEEVIRYDAPVQRLRRVVKEDVELAGVQLRAGDPLEVVVGSADRDEAVYDQPDVFDIDRFQPDRHAPPHLAFGKGAHFCIGANLARLEGVVALGTVLDRFKDIGLAEGWTPSYFEVTNVRGVTALPIEVAWA